MKKLISFIFLLCALCSFSSAQTNTCGTNVTVDFWHTKTGNPLEANIRLYFKGSSFISAKYTIVFGNGATETKTVTSTGLASNTNQTYPDMGPFAPKVTAKVNFRDPRDPNKTITCTLTNQFSMVFPMPQCKDKAPSIKLGTYSSKNTCYITYETTKSTDWKYEWKSSPSNGSFTVSKSSSGKFYGAAGVDYTFYCEVINTKNKCYYKVNSANIKMPNCSTYKNYVHYKSDLDIEKESSNLSDEVENNSNRQNEEIYKQYQAIERIDLPDEELEKNDSKLEIFPNPATEMVMVNTQSSSNATISVKDIYGKEVLNFSSLPNGNMAINVQIANLPKGVYYLTVLQDDIIRMTRFMK